MFKAPKPAPIAWPQLAMKFICEGMQFPTQWVASEGHEQLSTRLQSLCDMIRPNMVQRFEKSLLRWLLAEQGIERQSTETLEPLDPVSPSDDPASLASFRETVERMSFSFRELEDTVLDSSPPKTPTQFRADPQSTDPTTHLRNDSSAPCKCSSFSDFPPVGSVRSNTSSGGTS